MPRFIILSISILLLSLPLFSPCNAMAFMVKEGVATQKGAPSKAPAKATPSQAPSKAKPATASSRSSHTVRREVANIFVDRIEDGVIYSKDGRKFEITGSTRIIDNSHPVTKMRAAELSFENGKLVAVSLK